MAIQKSLSELLRKSNFLKYSGLTYEDIVSQIDSYLESRIQTDKRFSNFRDSEIVQILVEIFAGTTDILSYYLDRRAEECFFDTARLKSSVISNSRSLGYSIIRPIPAEGSLKLVITDKDSFVSNTNINSLTTEQRNQVPLQIPAHTLFDYDSKSFMTKRTQNIFFTSADVDILTNGDGEEFEITLDFDGNDFEVFQGEFQVREIQGTSNPQVGQTFQKYKIDDTTFSNRYGDEDFQNSEPLTKVKVGETFESAEDFTIDRRSLLNAEQVDSFNFQTDNTTTLKLCVVRTTPDEGVEVLFGDDNYARIGARDSLDNLYIQYVSTLGKDANKLGVIDDPLNLSNTIYFNTSSINSFIEFRWNSNITGGADLESIDSIRLNAPAIYYSLDRLVTRRDYIKYLESLTSPINIKNAIVFGEQDEIVDQIVPLGDAEKVNAIRKLNNVVLFSCMASLYKKDSANNFLIEDDLKKVVLDSDYRQFGFPSQNYLNVVAGQNVIGQLKFITDRSNEINETSATNKQLIVGDIINGDSDSGYFSSFRSSYSSLDFSFTLREKDSDDTVATINLGGISELFFSALTNFNQISPLLENQLEAATALSAGFDGFDSVSVEFEKTDPVFDIGRFKIVITDDKYFIKSFNTIGNTIFGSSFDNTLGLRSGNYSQTTFNEQVFSYSKNIDDVLNKLNLRSQVSVKNIYVSPIIQDFYLSGKVFIKNLIDKESILSSIKNNIIEFFDVNVDFNNPIYISNITEIIENNPEVLYSDVYFEPLVPQLPEGERYHFNRDVFDTDDSSGDPLDVRLLGWTGKSYIRTAVNSNLNAFINKYKLGGSEDSFSDTTIKYIYKDYVVSGTVSENTVKLSNQITERLFLSELARNMYNDLKTYTQQGLIFNDNSTAVFYESSDFYSILEDIHKDFMYIIKKNMLDDNGNILEQKKEFNINEKTIFKREKGGYSLGNEIVRVNFNLISEYKIS